MDRKIPEEVVEEVRLRSDIVDVIGEYVTLKRKGKNYLGLCPFHSEDTPSFTVTPDKQMFYCFGCNTGGNVFTFLMKRENWTFVETIENLALKNGIVLPEKELSPREKDQQRRKQRWEQIHDWAASYFHEILLQHPEGEPGRVYFSQRGIDEETIRSFRLGYAPNRWDGLLNALQHKGVKPQELAESGLILERDSGSSGNVAGWYDRFRNRVMFTILDSRQRAIAFGGRVLDDSVPKYLNSPETELFNKGHNLYGIHRAHQGIREQGFALLVEGYMDVIALQRVGFNNTVASLGTALTRDQAKLLRRYSQRVVICYDTDSAGIQAALRAGEILRDSGLRVDVLTIEGAKDPDEYLNKRGRSDFLKLIDKSKAYVEFKYHTLVKERLPQNAHDKQEVVQKLASDILKVTSPVEREVYERFLSYELGLTLEAIQREIESKDVNKSKNWRENEYSAHKQDISVKNRDNIIRCVSQQTPDLFVDNAVYRAEKTLIRLILEQPNLCNKVSQELGQDFWKVPRFRVVFEKLKLHGSNSPQIFTEFDDSIQSELAGIVLEEVDLARIDKLFDDCIRQIKSMREEETVEQLQARMAALEKSGDLAGAMLLLGEIGERLRSGEK